MVAASDSTSAREFMAFAGDAATLEAVKEAAALADLDPRNAHEGDLDAALSHLSALPAPAILLVDVSACDDLLACMNSLADACEEHTKVIAIGAVNDIELYRTLLDMGLTEYLVKPASAQSLAAALRRARTPQAVTEQRPETPCRKIALIGSKGGTGVTSLALSLGSALAHRHKLRTVLLDLDLRFGAMAMSLDLEPSRGLKEILSTPERIDSLLIESAVTPASERLRLLSAEEPLDHEIELPGEGVSALLQWLCGNSDMILMDVPRHLDRLGKAALAAADVICIVTDLSLIGMRDTKRMLAVASGHRETLIVANRVGGVSGEVPRTEFERGIGAPLDHILSNDPKAASEAADQGKPLLEVASNKDFSAELDRLAARLAGTTSPKLAADGAPSWLKRVFAR